MENEKHAGYRLFGLALAYHAAGRKKESDANLAELIKRLQSDAPFQIAEVYAFRGETNLALQWLQKAYDARDPGLIDMKGDPLLKSVEHDARYTTLLNEMHLPQ